MFKMNIDNQCNNEIIYKNLRISSLLEQHVPHEVVNR